MTTTALLKFISLILLVYAFGALLAIKTPGGSATFLFWNDCDD